LSELAVFVSLFFYIFFYIFDVNRLVENSRYRSFIGCRKSYELNSWGYEGNLAERSKKTNDCTTHIRPGNT